jgi:MFS family permease
MSATSAAVPAPAEKKGHLFGFEFPDFSVLKDHNVLTLIYSKNVQKLGMATLTYGASIYLAEGGASQIEISLVAAAGYLAALLFGSQGGAVVDKVEKRTALAVGYVAMATFCFVWPTLIGTSVVDLIALAFIVSSLSTITAPAIKATVALVATPAAMATVAAVLGLFGSFGTAIGQAFVAPILMKVSGIEACMYGAGVILASGGIWSLRVPKETGRVSPTQAVLETDWKPRALQLREIARWVMNTQTIATVVLLGSVVAALGETVGTLIPIYVRDVLDADPTYSVFIFAPAGLGYLAGTVSVPWLINRFGRRKAAFGSFLVTAVGIMAFAFVDQLAPILAPISPTRLFNLLPNVDLSDAMLAAGFIAMPANFGSTATAAAVQNFINARVSLIRQGGVFGMEKVVDNILTIVAVLGIGTIGTIIGSKFAFLIAPPATLGVVIWLIRYSYRRTKQPVPSSREVVKELWKGPQTDDSESNSIDAVTESQ